MRLLAILLALAATGAASEPLTPLEDRILRCWSPPAGVWQDTEFSVDLFLKLAEDGAVVDVDAMAYKPETELGREIVALLRSPLSNARPMAISTRAEKPTRSS